MPIQIDYSALPGHMRNGAALYLELGIPPGGFLRSLLEQDVVLANIRADTTNYLNMPTWMYWLKTQCPPDAWGSPEKVQAWIDKGGLSGKPRRYSKQQNV